MKADKQNKFNKNKMAKALSRRELIKKAGSGALIVALGGGLYQIASESLMGQALAEKRTDGRPRLPPGQKIIEALKPMGGQPHGAPRSGWQLKIYGEVEKPTTITYGEYNKMSHQQIKADVHCVTGWSLLGGVWTGLKLVDLAKRVGVKSSARHVIFEAAHGYSANIPIKFALKDNVMISHKLNNRVFATKHGAPVRALVPDLYFWKSAKWLTGIRFVRRDEPGYWETRGYHNLGDPWREERYG